MRFKGRQKALW